MDQSERMQTKGCLSCKICKKAFKKKAYPRNHMNNKHNPSSKKHACNLCKNVYPSHASLVRHLSTHTAESMKTCNICNQQFSKLASHLKSHGSKNIPCPLCNQTFVHKVSVKKHIEESHRGKPGGKSYKDMETRTKCKTCGKHFASRFTLATHVKQVHNDRKFQCPLCMAHFSSKGTCVQHVRKIHGQSGKEKCPECNKEMWKGNSKKHMEIHSDSRKTFPCLECSSVLASKEGLIVHQRMHRGEHKIPCPTCRVHIYRSHIQKHMRTHTDIESRKVKCPTCSKEVVETAIKRHLAIHKRGRPEIPCKICHKTFFSNQGLHKHRKEVHFGESKVECPKCNIVFANKYVLKKHMALHTDKRKTYKCEKCEKELLDPHNFKRHKLIHEDAVPKAQCAVCNVEITATSLKQHTVICLIEAPGAIARSNLIPWSKS